MYAIIKTGGKQYRVQQDDVIEIEKLNLEDGAKEVSFSDVLAVNKDGELRKLPFFFDSFVDERIIVLKVCAEAFNFQGIPY